MTITARKFRSIYRTLVAARKLQEQASKRLNGFPRGANGLTPDHVKFSQDFKEATASYRAHTRNVKTLTQTLCRADKVAMRALARRSANRPLSEAEKEAIKRVGL